MELLRNIGWPELLVIALILFFLFGGKKVKELSRGAGESAKELKKIKEDIKDEDN